MPRSRRAAAEVAVLVLVLVGSICGCAQTRPDLTFDDLDLVAADESCPNPVRMNGDPDFYGSAAGLYCLPSAGLGIVLRFYGHPGATFQMMDDWSELIDDENQVVYTDRWFATGPPDDLEELLGEFDARGPTSIAPEGEPMTADQADGALCSSVAYGVVTQLLSGDDGEALEEYFLSFPGLEAVARGVASDAAREHVDQVLADDLIATARLTAWDPEIKAFCR